LLRLDIGDGNWQTQVAGFISINVINLLKVPTLTFHDRIEGVSSASSDEKSATQQPAQDALAAAVLEMERHVATAGWDGPVRVFALVRTAQAIETDPNITSILTPDVVTRAKFDPHHLTSIEQEDLPAAQSLGELLARLAWPDAVDGVALVTERIVVPPEAEEDLPDNPDAATEALLTHPQRQDMRMAVGVLRSGESWCAIRLKIADDDASVAQGSDLVPELVSALLTTFE